MYNVVTICNACIILSSVIRFSIDMVQDYGNSSRKKDCSKIKWSRELLFACWNEMHGEKSCHFAGKWYIGGNIKGEKVRLLAYIAPFFCCRLYLFAWTMYWTILLHMEIVKKIKSNSLDHFILEQSFFLDEFP